MKILVCLTVGILGVEKTRAQVMPLERSVRTGKLANGLTYFIRKNTEPEKRATMYLVVKAGSNLETEEQRGLAHFMEHMSFNGTKHFPKNELIGYLQRSGIRFGADLNAYTSFDETVYQLPIPTDNADILQHGLQILRDWAQDATLDTAEINGERGVILEEKRLRMGAEQRLQEQTLPLLLNNSRYVHRMPIGTDQVLKNFAPATIKSFYRDWYRPNLQAVIIVGDIDVNAIETKVKQLFGDLRNPVRPKVRTDYTIALNGKNQYKAVTDSEVPQTAVEVTIKHLEHVNRTQADLRKSLVTSLFSSMFSSRLSEYTKRPDAPFQELSGGYGGLMGGLDALSVQIVPKKGEVKNGFLAAWQIIQNIKCNGFLQSEMERSKVSIRSGLEAQLKEKDKQSSTAIADQLKIYFLKGEAMPGIVEESELVNKLLPTITLAELNSAAKLYLKDTDRDIIITAPTSEKDNLPTEAQIKGWIFLAKKASFPVYKEDKLGKTLIASIPLKGSITSEKKIPEVGAIEWTLSNGAKVVLKPTAFKNDEVVFMATSPGGSSLYSDRDFESAANAPGIISSFGLGAYDNIALPKFLSGKQLAVQPFISDRLEGLQGSSSVKDLGTAIELIHLYFTAIRKDTALFAKIIQNSAQQIAARSASPDAVFADTAAAVLSAHNIRRTGPNLDKLSAISLDDAIRIYKERFANAGDFTFFFVGSFNPDTLKSYVEHYIGSLPGSAERETARDLGIHIPRGKLSKTVRAGKEDKATVRLVISGDYKFSEAANISLKALQEILLYRLTERLRETEGGVYTPNVQMNNAKYPSARYSFTIVFGCAPANVEKLIAATLDEIRKLKENGIMADDLQKFKAEELRQNELAARSNGFWLNYISGQYINGEDLAAFWGLTQTIEKLSETDLQQAAKKYLNEENLIQLVLVPSENKR